jgi:Fungal Zn(2)-Cys(6) binuclear cluster domain
MTISLFSIYQTSKVYWPPTRAVNNSLPPLLQLQIWILPRKREKIDVAFIWLVTNGVQSSYSRRPSVAYPKSNFLSRSRKIKCDGAHPVCSSCIRRRNPKCDYDDEPKRRGPDRRTRVRTHQDSGPLSIRPRRSQKRSSNDVGAGPLTPSTTESPPSTTPDASAIISRTGLSNPSPTVPRGSLDSARLYPFSSTSRAFQDGSVNESPAPDVLGGSSMHPSDCFPRRSETRPPTSNDPLLVPPGSRSGRPILNSSPALHPEPSPSTGIRDQSGNHSFLSNPSDQSLYPNFSRRSIVSTHYPYLPDSDPHSSSESLYTFPVQVATETNEVNQQIVPSPYIFAPSSFPMSMGTNIVHSDPSVEVCP